MLLGYRDRNVHELVCHEVAERTGEYRRRGVRVEVVDGRATPEAPLSAGLGGSLMESLRGRRSWRAALVQTVRPLFWLWARTPDPPDAVGRSVLAAHPEDSIVWLLTRRLTCLAGGGTDRLEVVHFPAGATGDDERLGALTRGEVDFAVVGASCAPDSIRRRGLHPYAFFGDCMQFPTAGIAVDTAKLAVQHPEVQAIAAAQRAAMERIQRAEPVVIDAVMDLLGTRNRQDAQNLVTEFLVEGYATTSEDVRELAPHAVRWLSSEISSPVVQTDFYSAL
jgi:hypothetical protein